MTVPAQATAAPAPSLAVTVSTAAGVDEGVVTTLYYYNATYDEWSAVDGSGNGGGDNSSDDASQGVTDINGLVTYPNLVLGTKYSIKFDGQSAHTPAPISYEIGRTTFTSPDFTTATAATATYLTAVAGVNKTAVTLAPGLTITGNILQPADGGPVPSTDADDVVALRQTLTPDEGTQWTMVGEDQVNSGDDTSYSIGNLAAGRYVFRAQQDVDSTLGRYAFNDAASSAAAATPLVISSSPSSPTTQDITFATATTLSGHLNFAGQPDGTDLTGDAAIYVTPVDSDGDDVQGDGNPAYNVSTDSNGNYSLSVLPGKYKVQFQPSNGNYFPSWYSNAADEDHAATVAVTGATTLADNTLGTGLGISGSVTLDGDSGNDFSHFTVTATDVNDDSNVQTTTPTGDGSYSFSGLQPGSYKIHSSDSTDGYADTYFTGSATPFGTTQTDLAKVISGITSDVTAVNIEYHATSKLTIDVSTATGTPATALGVFAQPMKDGQPDYSASANAVFANAVTGHPGRYELDQLDQGVSYAIGFASSGSPSVDVQYLGGADTPQASNLYTPSLPSSTMSVSLRATTSISGVVTSSAGKAIAGLLVELYVFDGTSWVNSYLQGFTNAKGAYSVTNLPTGSYKAEFSAPYGSLPYLEGFSGGASTLDAATSVYVSVGHPGVLSGKLATAGSISGTIVGGALTTNVAVLPVALTGPGIGLFTSAEVLSIEPTVSPTGKFTVTGLPSGYYALFYSDFTGHFGNTYAGMNSPSTPVYKVTAGATVLAGTITLPLASSSSTLPTVSGSLTGITLGEPSGSIDFASTDGGADTEAEVNPNGTFSTTLAAGTYTWTADVNDLDDPSALLLEPTGTVIVGAGGAAPISVDIEAVAPLAFTSPATIDSFDSRVGTTYTAGNVAFNRPTSPTEPVTVAYQWYRQRTDGTQQAIFGANAATYTSQGGDLGKQLSVGITISDGPFTNNVSQYETARETVAVDLGIDGVTPSDQLSNTLQPTIDSSIGKVGVALRANSGVWNGVTGLTYSYAWTSTRNGVAFPVGTNSPTYIPVAADGGATIGLTVGASKAGYTTPDAAPASNSAAIAVLGAPTVKVAPKITSKAGTAATGTLGDTIYTATSGTWSIAGAYTYEWYVNGVATASGASFTTNPNAGVTTTGAPVPVVPTSVAPTSAITVTVTDSPVGYTPVTSAAYLARLDTTEGTAEDGGAPNVTDTTNSNATLDEGSSVPVGDILSANAAHSIRYQDTSTEPTVFGYQWQRQTGSTWANIALATKATYTVAAADANHSLRVSITYSSPSNAVRVWTPVAAGIAVTNTALTLSSPNITFAPTNVYAPLTPVVTTVSSTWGTTTGVTNTYQWWTCINNCDTFAVSGGTPLNGYTPIAKATGTSYTPTASGQNLVLRVTGTKLGYTPGYTSTEPFEAKKSEALEDSPAAVALTGTGAALTKLTGTASATWGSVTGVTDTYQWYVCAAADCGSNVNPTHPTDTGFTPIAKATTNSYTPTLAQSGATVALLVAGNKVGYVTGYTQAVEKKVTAVITMLTPPSFTTATFGLKITAKAPTFDVAAPTLKYVWQTSTDGTPWVTAAGVNGAITYTPVLGDFASAGEQLRLEVSATKAGYNVGDGVPPATVTDSAPLALAKVTLLPTVKPTVKATVTAGGTTFTVSPGTWPSAGGLGQATYVWKVDGIPLDVDPNTTTVTPDALAPANAVTVTETWSGGAAYLPAVVEVIGQKGTAIPAQGGMDIQGTPVFGSGALSVPGDVSAYFDTSDDTGLMTYQWYYGTTTATTAIAGATASSYTPTIAAIGKKLFAKLTLTSPYFAPSTYITPGELFTAGAGVHGTPTITTATTVHPGATLAVDLGLQAAGTTHGYQWLYEAPGASTFTAIAGATKAIYLVTAAQLGGSIDAAVTNIRTGYGTVSDTTAASIVVQPSVLAPITQPTISGSTAAGSVLTAAPGSWNVTGTTFTYRWLRNGIALPGVTTATYTLTGEDSGDVVQAEVTGHVAGFNAVSVTTNSVAGTDAVAPKATIVPKVTGTAAFGSTLTATTGTWALDGLTFTYRWYDLSNGVGSAIDGADSATYVIASTDQGSQIYVVVTAKRAGYQSGTSQSAATALLPSLP